MEAVVGNDTDVWRCGVMLYAMIYCKYPFGTAQSWHNQRVVAEMFAAIQSGDLSLPALATPHGAPVSDACRDLLQGMLNVDRSRRFTLAHCEKHPWTQLISAVAQASGHRGGIGTLEWWAKRSHREASVGGLAEKLALMAGWGSPSLRSSWALQRHNTFCVITPLDAVGCRLAFACLLNSHPSRASEATTLPFDLIRHIGEMVWVRGFVRKTMSWFPKVPVGPAYRI